jgi:hypothetical protein
MQQQEIINKQLAQKIVDFIEPVIPYLIVSSKRAAEEACKQVGSEVWETKRKLWEKLCSTECVELKEAASDLIIAPSNMDVKQVLIQEILKLLEKNPDLVQEISSFMDYKTVQELLTKDSSARIVKQTLKQDSKQTLIDRIQVLEEFNRLLEAFIAKNIVSQGSELSEKDAEKSVPDQNISEKTASDLRMAQIAEIKQVKKTDFAKTNADKTDVEIQNEFQKAKTLLSIISGLEQPEKEEIMEEALDFASRIQYGDLRSQTLSLAVLYLNEPKKVKYIEKVLESASYIQDENERALVLSSLLPRLRGPGKEELIEDLFCVSHHLKYGDTKFQILSSLVPHLYGLKNEVAIEKALELIDVIFSDYQKLQALSFLIPYMKGQRKEEIIEQTFNLAFSLKDKDMRAEAISYILPHLDEAKKEELLKKALDLASGIRSESQKAEALSSLAPYLNES